MVRRLVERVRQRRRSGERHASLAHALARAPLHRRATLDPAIRRAARDRGPLPDALAGHVEKIRRHAYRVEAEDLTALERAGYTQEQIFELTVATAVGVGVRVLEAGLAALDAVVEKKKN